MRSPAKGRVQLHIPSAKFVYAKDQTLDPKKKEIPGQPISINPPRIKWTCSIDYDFTKKRAKLTLVANASATKAAAFSFIRVTMSQVRRLNGLGLFKEGVFEDKTEVLKREEEERQAFEKEKREWEEKRDRIAERARKRKEEEERLRKLREEAIKKRRELEEQRTKKQEELKELRRKEKLRKKKPTAGKSPKPPAGKEAPKKPADKGTPEQLAGEAPEKNQEALDGTDKTPASGQNDNIDNRSDAKADAKFSKAEQLLLDQIKKLNDQIKKLDDQIEANAVDKTPAKPTEEEDEELGPEPQRTSAGPFVPTYSLKYQGVTNSYCTSLFVKPDVTGSDHLLYFTIWPQGKFPGNRKPRIPFSGDPDVSQITLEIEGEVGQPGKYVLQLNESWNDPIMTNNPTKTELADMWLTVELEDGVREGKFTAVLQADAEKVQGVKTAGDQPAS